MAKKQLTQGRNRNPQNNSNTSARTKINKNRRRITETVNADSSSEDSEAAAVPSPSMESENNEFEDSSQAEDDGAEQRSSSDDEETEEEKVEEEEVGEEEEAEEQEEEEEPKKKTRSVKKRGKRDDAKSKGKKRSRKGAVELQAVEKSENALYKFPMNRISRIIKSENPDVRILQEAVFVINKATEKFLQVFCKEAYACAFRDKKKHTAYKHLSSVVSKQKKFQFLSDFVPEKVKARDALPEVTEPEPEK